MAEPTVERAHPPIVAAVDGSEVSRRALRRAGSLAAALGAELIVVHGVGLLEGAGYRDHVELEEVVIAELGPERAHGAPAVRTVVQDGPAALVVARVVADHGAGLVVVGRRGRGRTTNPLGSTTSALLETVGVDVLVVADSPPALPAPPPPATGRPAAVGE